MINCFIAFVQRSKISVDCANKNLKCQLHLEIDKKKQKTYKYIFIVICNSIIITAVIHYAQLCLSRVA